MAEHLTREDKRIIARVEKEAQLTHKRLAERFQTYFVTALDPEGEDVKKLASQVSAQWKTFCHRNNLKKEAYPLLQVFCDNLVTEYIKIRDGKEEVVSE